ncbi:MAG: hypothetical protein OEV93_03580 [Candidatus Moranbacteria bacterium]|nr:hypothetical protein [Candidatus Moranbacteria bacterium]
MGELIISNSEDPLSSKLNYKISKERKKNLILFGIVIVLIIVGCFYLNKQDVVSGAQANFEVKELAQKEIENESVSRNQKEEVNVMLNDFTAQIAQRDIEREELESELYEMVGDYPVRDMVPYISKYDREVAALIVGIAKKESNWGKRSPLKNDGETCYNYWGFKGAGSEGIAMGHGCFGTPEEAVDAIGKRIEELVAQGLNTPSKMIVWKCGRSCDGHAPGSAQKWVSDVNIYYSQIVRG